MPRKFTYVENHTAFIFTLPDNVCFPESKDPNDLSDPKLFHHFLKTTFISALLPALSKMIMKNYKYRLQLKDQTTNEFLIEDLNISQRYYFIRLAGIAKVIELSRYNVSRPSNNSYVIIKNSLSKSTLNANQAATAIVLASVKPNLFEYCKEVQSCLDEEKGVLGKYNKVNAFDTSELQKEADKIKRQNFLNCHFSRFYKILTRLLLEIKDEDIQSINFDKPTLNAKKFILCFESLNAAGFYNVNQKPINFWSGPEAQVYANETLDSLSDSNVPATNIMMYLGKLLLQKRPKLSAILCGGSSAVFASQAQGNVVVYNSSGFNKEEGAVLTAGNFHWENELPILQRKKHAGEVTLKISFYNRIDNVWNEPIHLSRKNQFKIVRRESYKSPNKKLHDRNPSIYNWPTNKGRPRKTISMTTIANCFNKWRFYKRDQAKPIKILSNTMSHWLTYQKS